MAFLVKEFAHVELLLGVLGRQGEGFDAERVVFLKSRKLRAHDALFAALEVKEDMRFHFVMARKGDVP